MSNEYVKLTSSHSIASENGYAIDTKDSIYKVNDSDVFARSTKAQNNVYNVCDNKVTINQCTVKENKIDTSRVARWLKAFVSALVSSNVVFLIVVVILIIL